MPNKYFSFLWDVARPGALEGLKETRRGWNQLVDLLATPDYAEGEALKAAIDKYYYGDKDISLLDILGAAGEGALGGLRGSVRLPSDSKTRISALWDSPRYGEPLTALQQKMELGGLPAILGGPAEVEALPREPGEPQYHRTKTLIPPILYGMAAETAASPLTWLRGPGPTAKGQQAKLLGEAVEHLPAAEKAALGYRAALRGPFGKPLVKGTAAYEAGAGLRKGLAGRGKLTDVVEGIGSALSPKWRPGISEAGEEIIPTLSDAEWNRAGSAIRQAMSGGEQAGAKAAQDFAQELKGVKFPRMGAKGYDKWLADLGQWERTGVSTPVVADYTKVLEAVEPKWRGQLERRGAQPLTRLRYQPRGAKELSTPLEPAFTQHREIPGTLKEAIEQAPALGRTHPVAYALERERAGAASDFFVDALHKAGDEMGEPVATAAEAVAKAQPGYVLVGVNPVAGWGPGARPWKSIATPEDAEKLSRAGVRVFSMPEEVVDFSNKMSEALDSTQWPAVMKVYRGFLSHWKPSQLGVRMGYWMRNLGTEHFWNYLDDPTMYTPQRAVNAWKLVEGTPFTVHTPTGPVDSDALQKGFGLLRSQGFFASDEPTALAARATRTPMQRVSGPSVWMMKKLAPIFEDHPRAIQFLDQVEKGVPMDGAAQHVHDFHINYGELTHFQNKWIKTFFPFSTFPIGAGKIIAREAVRDPNKIAMMGRLQSLVENMTAKKSGVELPTEAETPEFLQGQDPVFAGQVRPGVDRIWPSKPWSPLGQVSETMDYATNPSAWMRAAGPIGSVIGAAANRNWLTGQETERVPGELGSILGIPIRKRAEQALGVLPYIASVSEIERLNPGNVFGTTERPGWTGAKARYEQPNTSARLMDLLYGIRTYSTNRADAKSRFASSQLALAKDYLYKRNSATSEHDRAYYQRMYEETLARAREKLNE